jgi:two-component sensor histidine kinase
MDSVLVTIDTAIPCGLIINEIISNALKHAFPNNKKGEIRIGLHSPNRGKIEIVIADNGIGMSKDLDLRQVNSLGLQIVSNVVEKQLQGEIDLILGRGTEFRIWFREHHQSKKGLMDEKNKDNDC